MNHLETHVACTALWTTALLLMACGGTEVPSVDSEATGVIAREYGRGANVMGNGNSGSSNGASSMADLDPSAGDSDEDAPDMETPDPNEDDPPAMDPESDPEPSAGAPDCDGFAIIQENCGQGGCHGSSNLGNFGESEAAARSYIGRSGALTCASNGPIIDPENPSDSVLVLKLSDDPPCGNYMPPNGAFLPASDVQCITNWIANLE